MESETAESHHQYCSELSAHAGETMLGTSPEVDYWLMLEYSGRWEARSVENNDLPANVRSWLDDTVEELTAKGYRPRLQFIRQRRSSKDSMHFFVCDADGLRQLVVEDVSMLADVDVSTDVVENVDENQYFVCTNGARDRCCSRFGLPTWRTLEETINERSWQTTHLGGHRYAPNVLVLPHGRLYGRVHPENVEELVSTVETGAIATKFLRGRAEFSSAAQVCELFADCPVKEVIDTAEDSVTFSSDLGQLQVQMPARGRGIEVLASCGDEEPTLVYPIIDI